MILLNTSYMIEILTAVTGLLFLLISCIKKDLQQIFGKSLILIALLALVIYGYDLCLLPYDGSWFALSSLIKFPMLLWLVFFYKLTHSYLIDSDIPLPEFYALTLFATTGVFVLIDGDSLITLFLGVELVSLPSYVLVALALKDNMSKESAVKYLMIGAVGSALILIGFTWTFGLTGQVDLTAISEAMLRMELNSYDHQAVLYGFILAPAIVLLTGMLLKLGVAPFHWWVADTYQGANMPTTLFISTLPKFGLAAVMFHCLTTIYQPLEIYQLLCQYLIIVGVFSVMYGNISALVQYNVKRLLAYSSIGHMGIVIVILAIPENYGQFQLNHLIIAYAYLMIYALSSTILFSSLMILSPLLGLQISIDDMKSMYQQCPRLALFMLVALLSAASLPPLAGFFIKLFVIVELIQMQWIGSVVLVLLSSAVGLYYYLNWVRMMYFYPDIKNLKSVITYKIQDVILYICSALLLLMAIYPDALLRGLNYQSIY